MWTLRKDKEGVAKRPTPREWSGLGNQGQNVTRVDRLELVDRLGLEEVCQREGVAGCGSIA